MAGVYQVYFLAFRKLQSGGKLIAFQRFEALPKSTSSTATGRILLSSQLAATGSAVIR